jgi:hypothetical protein
VVSTGSLIDRGARFDSMLESMEAFLVVVLAAALLCVGGVALAVLLRTKEKMDPTDPQER